MNPMLKILVSIVLGLNVTIILANPNKLVIRNTTGVELNEYIDGSIPAIPTPAYSVGSVPWVLMEMACYGHTENGKCSALIKLATDTDKPFKLGRITIDMKTGKINPKTLEAHGYKFTVKDKAEATLTKMYH